VSLKSQLGCNQIHLTASFILGPVRQNRHALSRPIPKSTGPQEWSPEVQAFIQGRQELDYRRLAQTLNLSSDPLKAYGRIAALRMPSEHVSAQWFEQTLGDQVNLTPKKLV
jgi:hypothetical protein